ncbi:MAG: DUF1800 domain-containing protein [Gemmatimonadota bacterium]
MLSADPSPQDLSQEQEAADLSAASGELERTNRRRFFAMGVSLAAASVAGATSVAGQASPPRKTAVRGMVKKLLDSEGDPSFDPFRRQNTGTTKGWDSTLTRLVRRVTNGVTEEELKLAQKLGFYGYLNYHLDHTKIDDTAVNQFVSANYPLLNSTVEAIYSLDQRLVADQLIESNLYRAAFSKRQLYERMVEFWADHFNISIEQARYLLLVDNREVVRRHAFGNFHDMVKASAHSAAMLEYLDNTRNRRTTLNENYAREIMELHTVGVGGGYTQGDVRELARCFTGWTLSGRGNFAFDPNGHDFGAKTVMGQSIAAMPQSAGMQGKSDADFMIDYLIRHPATARFVGKKMLRWLLQYEPTDAQITTVAAAYTKTNGDIKAMIRAILTPANLNAAAPKFKRPYTFVLSALRATKPAVTKVASVADRYLIGLGQGMFMWEPPDGYPDRADYWAGGVLQRWNFATYITTVTGSEMNFDVNRFMTVVTVDGVADAISRELFGGDMPERLKGQLKTYLGAGTLNQTRVRETIALALSSSTFQWA